MGVARDSLAFSLEPQAKKPATAIRINASLVFLILFMNSLILINVDFRYRVTAWESAANSPVANSNAAKLRR